MSLLQRLNAEQLQAQDEAKEAARFEQTPQINTSRLVSMVREHWEIAKQDKLDVTERLLACLYAKKGEYSPEKLRNIKEAGGVATIYMQITANKCRAAKAWLGDLFSPTGDRPFDLSPTPIHDLPPDIEERLYSEAINSGIEMGVPLEQIEMLLEKHEDRLRQELQDEAEERADRAADYIEDMMVEGGWRKTFNEFLDDLTTYPAAILKAPVLKMKRTLEWVQSGDGYEPKVTKKIFREFKRVSPFDFYPSSSGTWNIEHVKFNAKELASLRGVKGYRSSEIAQVLINYRDSGFKEWAFNEGEREQLEGKRGNPYNKDEIDGLEYNGWVQGAYLREIGLSEEVITDELEEYPVSIVLINNYIIRALVNPHPTGESYYNVSTWETVPGSIWGKALPEILKDTQDACNSAARALINNMAIGSGAQVAVDIASRPAGESNTKLVPWKIWYFDGNKSKNAGISFFQPELKAGELLNVYERFVRYSDEITGLPSYAFGSDQGAGAAKTASGLSMLMNAASKTIKEVVRNVDIGVIEPVVGALYITLMLDPEIPMEAKGDARIKSRGSDALVHKEAELIRQQELLAATNNPTDMQIIGLEGRREQLEDIYKANSLGHVVPTKDELQQRLAAQQPQQGEEDGE